MLLVSELGHLCSVEASSHRISVTTRNSYSSRVRLPKFLIASIYTRKKIHEWKHFFSEMTAAHNPKLPLYFIDFAPRTTGSVFSDEFLQLINARRIHRLDSLTDVKGPVKSDLGWSRKWKWIPSFWWWRGYSTRLFQTWRAAMAAQCAIGLLIHMPWSKFYELNWGFLWICIWCSASWQSTWSYVDLVQSGTLVIGSWHTFPNGV